MSISTRILRANNRDWTILKLENQNGHVEVVPEAGFSMISFVWKGHELLDQWDLNEFLGSKSELEWVASKTTQSFRKGFAPSIGPWFGSREPSTKCWQHGVCRYAEWSEVEVGDSFIRGRLVGNQHTLLEQSIDEICGFELDIEITYELTSEGLEYRQKNLSKDQKGVFGIHWYWKNPRNTRVVLKRAQIEILCDQRAENLIENPDEVVADMNSHCDHIFINEPLGLGALKGRIQYADQRAIDFYYDDAYAYTVLFSTKKGLCLEPVSALPGQKGLFDHGTIRIVPNF